jgi:hypothetical protein
MRKNGINIDTFWQSQDRMKFDFSLSDSKKIEVKTTTSDTRKHKFRHEQLVSDIYDTWIVSLLLRKDDKGLSLYELTNTIKNSCPGNLNLHTRISLMLSNYTVEELSSIRFNSEYITQNISFYRTIDIPKFKDKQPVGVTNTEYDSDLTSIKKRHINELTEWMY